MAFSFGRISFGSSSAANPRSSSSPAPFSISFVPSSAANPSHLHPPDLAEKKVPVPTMSGFSFGSSAGFSFASSSAANPSSSPAPAPFIFAPSSSSAYSAPGFFSGLGSAPATSAPTLFGTPSPAASGGSSPLGMVQPVASSGPSLFGSSASSAASLFGTPLPSSSASSGLSLFATPQSAASSGSSLFGAATSGSPLFGTSWSTCSPPAATLTASAVSAGSSTPASSFTGFGVTATPDSTATAGLVSSFLSSANTSKPTSSQAPPTPAAVSAFSVPATTSAATTASSASTTAAPTSSLFLASSGGTTSSTCSADAVPKLPSEIVSIALPTSTASTPLQEANLGTVDPSSVPPPEPAEESTVDLSDVELADLDAVDEILGVIKPRCEEPLPSRSESSDPSTPVPVDDIKAKWKELYQLTKGGYSQIASNSALEDRIKNLLAELSSGEDGFTKTPEFKHECEMFATYFGHGTEFYRQNSDKIESSTAVEENFNKLEDRLTAGKETLRERRSSYQGAVDRKAELTEEKGRLEARLADVLRQIESNQLEIRREGSSMKQQLREVVATMQDYDRQQAEVDRHLSIRRECVAANRALDEHLSNFRRNVRSYLV